MEGRRKWPHHDHQEDRWCHGKVKNKPNSGDDEDDSTAQKERLNTQINDNMMSRNSIETDDVGLSEPGAQASGSSERQRNFSPCLEMAGSIEYYRKHELENLTDDDILHKCLPRTKRKPNVAERTVKCTYSSRPECKAIGTKDCQGYCNKHFCELARSGLLQIPRNTSPVPPLVQTRCAPDGKGIVQVDSRKGWQSSSDSDDKSHNVEQPFSIEVTPATSSSASPSSSLSDKENSPLQQHTQRDERNHFTRRDRGEAPSRLPLGTVKSSDSSSPDHSPPLARRDKKPPKSKSRDSYGSRLTNRRNRGNPDVVESGEDENEVDTARSKITLPTTTCIGPTCYNRAPTATCIGPTCYNRAPTAPLCQQCHTILLQARHIQPPPQPSNRSQVAPLVSSPIDITLNINQGFGEGYTNTNPYHDRQSVKPRTRQRHPHFAPELRHDKPRMPSDHVRRAPSPTFDLENDRYNAHPTYLPGQDMHHGRGRRCDPCAPKEPPRVMPHTRERHEDLTPELRHYAPRIPDYRLRRGPILDWQNDRYNEAPDEPPNSMLSNASSVGMYDDAGAESSFAESVTPYSKGLQKCKALCCKNWGNRENNGYCNECYMQLTDKRH